MSDITFNKIVANCFGEVVSYVKEEGLDITEVSIDVLKRELSFLFNSIDSSVVNKEAKLLEELNDISVVDLYELSVF